MARSALALLAVASLVATAFACSAPDGACEDCSKYVVTDYNDFADGSYDTGSWPGAPGQKVGFYMGAYNKNKDKTKMNDKGSPAVNYEKFDVESGYALWDQTADWMTMATCCNSCKGTSGCVAFQFFPKIASSKFVTGGRCILLKGGSASEELVIKYKKKDGTVETKQFGLPFSGTKSQQQCASPRGSRCSITPSFVVAKCNPDVGGDPHFVGAQGTKFDFNGELDKSFCLATDTRVQLNALIKGYNVPAEQSGKGLRSWIREVGLLWIDEAGVSHALHMVARAGKEQKRGSGFLASISLDGKAVPVPTAAMPMFQSGLLTLAYQGATTQGPFDVDRYTLLVDGLIDLGFSLRVAHPRLQSSTDAWTHFNLMINSIQATDKIHGVLGQTYRTTEAQTKKALKYSELSRLLSAPVVADGETGRGFLEGSVQDYETTVILAPDCKFSSFSA